MLTGHQQFVPGEADAPRRGPAGYAFDLNAAVSAALAGVQVVSPAFGVNVGYPPAVSPEQPDYVLGGDPFAVGRFEIRVGGGRLDSGPADSAHQPGLDRGHGLQLVDPGFGGPLDLLAGRDPLGGFGDVVGEVVGEPTELAADVSEPFRQLCSSRADVGIDRLPGGLFGLGHKGRGGTAGRALGRLQVGQGFPGCGAGPSVVDPHQIRAGLPAARLGDLYLMDMKLVAGDRGGVAQQPTPIQGRVQAFAEPVDELAERRLARAERDRGRSRRVA